MAALARRRMGKAQCSAPLVCVSRRISRLRIFPLVFHRCSVGSKQRNFCGASFVTPFHVSRIFCSFRVVLLFLVCARGALLGTASVVLVTAVLNSGFYASALKSAGNPCCTPGYNAGRRGDLSRYGFVKKASPRAKGQERRCVLLKANSHPDD